MPVKIDENYRRKVSGVVKRNMARDVPIKNIFGMLAGWRSVDRILTIEECRDFAMEMVEKERKGGGTAEPVVVNSGDQGNVTHISFVRG